MLTVGKYARALPSLLDLKERGTGPRELSETVVGTVDTTPLYLLQGRETFLTAVAAPVAGSFVSFTTVVPSGEIWYVWNYWIAAVTGAGAAVSANPGVLFDGISGVPTGLPQAAPANSGIWVPSSAPFIATPGSTFGFHCQSQTLAPNVQGGLVVTKLRV